MIADDSRWFWDSWYAHDGDFHHAFFLAAPKSLGDPDLRHASARVGHAVSRDLREWTMLADALEPGAPGRFDDRAIWTGSVIRDGDVWRMFYTGTSVATGHSVQRIGQAVSSDLMSWERVSSNPLVTADPRWYSTLDRDGDEPFRDPWVVRHDGRWHMLVTATDRFGAGCIGHAVSEDLLSWEVRPPLTSNSGFRQLEVVQTTRIAGAHVVVFCTGADDVLASGLPARTGTWSAPADGPLGPFHLNRAEPIDDRPIYAGRIVEGPAGPVLLGFDTGSDDEPFTGVIGDPISVGLSDRWTLRTEAAGLIPAGAGVSARIGEWGRTNRSRATTGRTPD